MLLNDKETATPYAVDAPSSKRKLLKLLGTGAMSASVRVPTTWSAPLVATVLIPSHAQASGPTSDPCGSKGNSIPGSEGSGGPTKTDPEACCSSLRPANPSYPTDPTYMDEECCANPGKTDPTICCDENVADKTDPRYVEQCCDKPGRDVNGNYVTDAQGNYLCCDDLDPNSSDYDNYCCENQAKDSNGDLAKDGAGNAVCCEGAQKDPEFCCIKKEVTYSKSIPRETTNWTTEAGTGTTQVDSVELPQWDPADGPLAEVVITVTGDIDSTGWYESIDASTTTATFTAGVALKTVGPDGILLQADPTSSVNKELPPGDHLDPLTLPHRNEPNYWEVPTVNASESESRTVNDPTDLQQYYLGTSRVRIEMTAEGVSGFSSTGANGASFIQTFAAASITITYFCEASEV